MSAIPHEAPNFSDYIAHGFHLVRIKPGTKEAKEERWGAPENSITSQAIAAQMVGAGIHHLNSRTCCVDVDDWESCEAWFSERGIDLSALMMADDSVQIRSGREGRAKLLYRLPDSVDWLPYVKTANGKLELRSSNSLDSSQMDVLPPSIHPDTGKPYEWAGAGDWRSLPELPEQVLTAWIHAHHDKLRAFSGERPKSAQSGVIADFNATHHPGDILEKHGYQRIGKRWRAPDSTTGIAGVLLLPGSQPPRIYSHHGSDPLALDQRSHDAFSVFTVLEHGGNAGAAFRAIAANNSERGKRLAKRISDQLAEALGLDDEEAPKVDHEAISRMVNRAFWSGSRGKLFLLNDSNSVNQYSEKDAWQFLCRACGTPLDMADIAEKAKAVIIGDNKREIEKQINSILAIPRSVVLSDLKWTNQRDHVQWRVDMFADQPRMELLEDAARIVLPHVGFADFGEPEPDIVADYKQHFPELERVMSMIVAARFAGDRKKAYLWMLASSDWGKGFFTACLRELGLVVEMSVKEIERVFEGQPAGKRPEQFKRAWVLAVNEFKSVKAEVKQLESVMQIAPKNQLTSEVELFAKLFLSAENVASLVTDHGVEDQFLKRFSLIDKQGTIDDRPLFSRDPGRYRRAVVAWMSRYLNQAVADYQRLGRDAADRDATKALHDFHAEYGLANFHASFSHSMKDVAREFRDWLDDLGSQDSQANLWCPDGDRYRCLKNASRALEHFLNERMSSEQVPTIKRRKDDIFKYLSVDGKGNYPHRFAGQVGKVRCVRFERLSE